MDESKTNFVMTQIKYVSEDYTAVIELYDNFSSNSDSEISDSFDELAADTYLKLKEYSSAIELYQKLYEKNQSTSIGRKLAGAYINIANAIETAEIIGTENEKNGYLKESAEIYEKIIEQKKL